MLRWLASFESISTQALAPSGSSPWKRLTNAPSFEPGTMLLASDGSVLVHEEPETGGTSAWWRLTPDAKGSYIDGTWSKIASRDGCQSRRGRTLSMQDRQSA